jgi:CheY-like chemotaxis protein
LINNADVTKLVTMSKNLNILYVEDDEFIRAQMTNMLSDIFTNLKIAKNGKEALDLIDKEHFNMLITDAIMPVVDGFELVQKIRDLQLELKIILISAIEDADLKKFDILNIDAFIPKPIEPSRLFEALLLLCDTKA